MKLRGRGIPDQFVNRSGWSVVVAEMDRQWGGPEEGGWWYDSYRVVYIEYGRTMSEATAGARAVELENGREFAQTGRPLWSVNYTGGTYHTWTLAPGETEYADGPRTRPHYE